MKYLLLTCSALLLSSAAFAQDAPAPAANANAGQPIEISATKTVEWLRNEKKYVARENVVVTQGGMTINTDLLTADYRETPQSATEIWQLTAEGNVIIKDDTNTAYGDLGVYDVTTGIATLTGQNLKLVSRPDHNGDRAHGILFQHAAGEGHRQCQGDARHRHADRRQHHRVLQGWDRVKNAHPRSNIERRGAAWRRRRQSRPARSGRACRDHHTD